MTASPHDALFKAVFGQPEHARGALRAALPVAIAEAIEWAQLATSPGSFIDPELGERHTDLLFSTRWRGGGEALLYLLFEHQSTQDDRMAFRLLRYLVRIWERWLAGHPRARALPAIIPIVLYHGEAPWTAPVDFASLVELPAAARTALGAYQVQMAYTVDDLSVVPAAVLRGRAMSALGRLVELCFQHARTPPDLLAKLASWAEVVREVAVAPHGLAALALVMRYVLLVSDHVEPEHLAALVERVVGPEAKDEIMTVGERLIEQGRQQGQRALLLRQLRARFGATAVAAVEGRVAAATPGQLERWADLVLTAASIDDALAG